jgi:hypothetical protein
MAGRGMARAPAGLASARPPPTPAPPPTSLSPPAAHAPSPPPRPPAGPPARPRRAVTHGGEVKLEVKPHAPPRPPSLCSQLFTEVAQADVEADSGYNLTEANLVKVGYA